MNSEVSIQFTSDQLAELLDPKAWRIVLDEYAGTVKLAIALTDPAGCLLGECHNPQPVWRLARQVSPVSRTACAFCLTPATPCTAVLDALSTAAPVIVQDRSGLTHVAVPLSLGGQNIGALVAGQVFSQDPEPLPLQRAAKELGISPDQLWQAAIQEPPISLATLQIYASLLMTLGQAFLRERYATILHRELAIANQSIRRSMHEKDVVMREIQHRVKNNLQIVSSLLSLQSDRLDDANHAGAVEVLAASQQRVATMARIHDLLYSTEQSGEIDLAEYVRNLAQMVVDSSQAGVVRIRARFNLTPVRVAMRQAIPCGLIVNELITNVFKYAYRSGQSGDVDIGVASAPGDRVFISISDSGMGMPPGLDWQQSKSLGFEIIRILTRQLGGTLTLATPPGVSFTLEFQRAA